MPNVHKGNTQPAIDQEEHIHISNTAGKKVFLVDNRDNQIIDFGGGGRSAFGELSAVEPTPVVQVTFPYNINGRIMETRLNGGTATIDTNRLKISTGASANQAAIALTKIPVKYNAGQGGLARFTTIYTIGVAGSEQIMGVGSSSDGYFFGYNGADFGVLRRSGGACKIVQLIVTTKATSAGTVTVTLDGDGGPVEVTDATSGDTTTTANDIAAGDFSGVGTGWRTYAAGSTVTFISYDAAAHGGSYSFADTDTTGAAVTGGVTNVVTGIAATDTWVAQTSWSDDVMDGTGNSGVTLDTTKGNVYQIRYQWLGYGMISFFIEDPATGKLVRVHSIQYANANTLTSVQNPTLPVFMSVINTSNTSNIEMLSPSIAGFIEGKEPNNHFVRNSADAEDTDVDEGSEQPILSVRNKPVYQGEENRTRIQLTFLEVSTSVGNKPVRIRFRVNGALTAASYADVDASDSVVEKDSAATAISGGSTQFSSVLNSSGNRLFNLDPTRFRLNPGDVFTVTAQQTSAGTNSTVDVAINWVELF